MSKREIRAKRLVAAVLLAISVQMWSAPPLWAAEASVQTETSAAGEAKETKDAKDAKAADSETGGEADAGEEETVVVPVIGYSTRSAAGSDYGVMPLADMAVDGALTGVTGINGSELVVDKVNNNFFIGTTEYGGSFDKNSKNNAAIGLDIRVDQNGNNSVFGIEATGWGESVSVFGYNATADNFGSSFGAGARSEDGNGSAFGYNAEAWGGTGNSAFGYNAKAISGGYGVAVGAEAKVESAGGIAIGGLANVEDTKGSFIGGIAIGQEAHTNNERSIAIGYDAESTLKNSIAIGAESNTTAENQVSFGTGFINTINGEEVIEWTARRSLAGISDIEMAGALTGVTSINGSVLAAMNEDVTNKSLAIGAGAVFMDPDSSVTTISKNAIAIGNGTKVLGDGSLAIGYYAYQRVGAFAGGIESIAINGWVSLEANYNIAIGGSVVDADNVVAIGYNAASDSSNAVAIGSNTYASYDGTALGYAAQGTYHNAVAIGAYSGTTEENQVSFGHKVGDRNYADGSDYSDDLFRSLVNVADIDMHGNISLGGEWTKNATSGVYESNGKGELTGVTKINGAVFRIANNETVLGANADAGERGVAFGYTAKTVGEYGVAIGAYSNSSKSFGVALGYVATINASGGTALGADALVAHENSVALGSHSVTNAANQVSFGHKTGDDDVDSGDVYETDLFRSLVNVADIDMHGNISLGGEWKENTTSGLYESNGKGELNGVTSINGVIFAKDSMNNQEGLLIGTPASGTSFYGDTSVMIGLNIDNSAIDAVGIGNNIKLTGDGSVAIGYGAEAMSNMAMYPTAIGFYARAIGDDVVAIGAYSYAEHEYSVALGDDSSTSAEKQVSFGHKAGDKFGDGGRDTYRDDLFRSLVNVADIEMHGNISLGGEWSWNDAGTSYKSNGLGNLTGVIGINGIEFLNYDCGDGPVLAIGSTIGNDSTANSVGLGINNTIEGYGSVSIGVGTNVRGNDATGVGSGVSADGENSVAVGSNAFATADGATAVGSASRVYAEGGSALGYGTSVAAAHTNSVAIGAKSATGAANQVSFGHKVGDRNEYGGSNFTDDLFRSLVNVADIDMHGALTGVTGIDGVTVSGTDASTGLTVGGNAVIGKTDTPFSSTGFAVAKDGAVTAKTVNGAAITSNSFNGVKLEKGADSHYKVGGVDVTKMQTDVAGKADAATVTALDTRVGKSETDIGTLKTTVGDSSKGLVKDTADLKAAVGDSSKGLVKQVSDVDTAYKAADTVLQGRAKTLEDKTAGISRSGSTTTLETNTSVSSSGITTNKATVSGATATTLENGKLTVGAATVQNTGFAVGSSSLNNGSLTVDGNNKLTTAGLTASKVTVGAVTVSGGKVSGLTDAALSAVSTEAVTGKQLNATNTTVSALDTAYKAADTQIRTDFAAADTTLQNNIDAKVAQTAYDTKMSDLDSADTALGSRAAALETAVNDSTTGLAAVNTKVGALDTAYQAADTQIRTDFAAADTALKTELNTAIDEKAKKATDLAGYGITDAYTKTAADEKITAATADMATKTQVTADIGTAKTALESAYQAADTALSNRAAALETAATGMSYDAGKNTTTFTGGVTATLLTAGEFKVGATGFGFGNDGALTAKTVNGIEIKKDESKVMVGGIDLTALSNGDVVTDNTKGIGRNQDTATTTIETNTAISSSGITTNAVTASGTVKASEFVEGSQKLSDKYAAKTALADYTTTTDMNTKFADYATTTAVDTKLADYAKSDSVYSKAAADTAFAKAGDVDTLKTTVGDADGGLVKDVTELQSGKADKATTLAGYGIADAYTQTEINEKIVEATKDLATSATVTDIQSGLDEVTGKTAGLSYDTASGSSKFSGSVVIGNEGAKTHTQITDDAIIFGEGTDKQVTVDASGIHVGKKAAGGIALYADADGTHIDHTSLVTGSVTADNLNGVAISGNATDGLSVGGVSIKALSERLDSLEQDGVATADMGGIKRTDVVENSGKTIIEDTTSFTKDGLKTANLEAATAALGGVNFAAGAVTGVSSINGVVFGSDGKIGGVSLSGGKVDGVDVGWLDQRVKSLEDNGTGGGGTGGGGSSANTSGIHKPDRDTTNIEGNTSITTDGIDTNKVNASDSIVVADGEKNKTVISKDGILVAEGEKNQVKINEDGIHVGKNSSVVNDTDGFITDKGLYIGVSSSSDTSTAKFSVAPNGNLSSKAGDYGFSNTSADGAKFTHSGDTAYGTGSQLDTTIQGNKVTTGRIDTDELYVDGNKVTVAGGTIDKTDAVNNHLSGADADGNTVTNDFKTSALNGTTQAAEKTSADGKESTKTVNNTSAGGTGVTTSKTTTDSKDNVTVKESSFGTNEKGMTLSTSNKVTDKDGKVTKDTSGTTTMTGDSISVSKTTTTTEKDADGNEKEVTKTSGTTIGSGEVTLKREDGSTIEVGSAIEGMQSDMRELDGRVNRMGVEIKEVGALSAALAGLHPQPENANSRADFAMAMGSYEGKQALAVGGFYRPDKRTMLSIGASTTSSKHMMNMGISIALDRLPEAERRAKEAAKAAGVEQETLNRVLERLAALEQDNRRLQADNEKRDVAYEKLAADYTQLKEKYIEETADRQQKVADKFMAVLSGDAAAVTQLQVDMVPELAEKMTAANFAALQKQLKEQFGIQKSVRFAVYERFDQGDRLTYLVGFSRQQAVRAVYGFDKNGKLSEFVFVPLEVKAAQK